MAMILGSADLAANALLEGLEDFGVRVNHVVRELFDVVGNENPEHFGRVGVAELGLRLRQTAENAIAIYCAHVGDLRFDIG